MADVEPLEIIRGIYAAVAVKDWDGVLARISPAAVFEQSSALPFAGVWHGHDGFQKMGAAIFAAWPDFAVEPVSFSQSGSVVLVMTRVSGSNPAGDAPLNQTMIESWRVAGNVAVECRPFYFDPVVAARSAGVVPG
jgi:uncharacterized protein